MDRGSAEAGRFTRRTPAEIARRYLLLCAGLGVMALGVAFSIKSDLGTSPISSVPYALSLLLPMTVGQATIALHCALVLLQLALLRSRFSLGRLVQVPIGVLFGLLTDAAMGAVQAVCPQTYLEQWACCLVGVVLVSVGVSFEFKADVVMLAGEGAVDAFSKVLPIQRGNMKVLFDVSLVVVACSLTLGFLGRVEGVREGTVAAALLVGLLAKRLGRLLRFSFS